MSQSQGISPVVVTTLSDYSDYQIKLQNVFEVACRK
jgi:hypothetical protein